MATDLLLKEEGNGGDLVLEGNRLALATSFQNMPYLGMLGGNVEQSTVGPKEDGEQALDWWGNYLLLSQQQELQFNSIFERKMAEVSISSAGRLEIERAVKEDIKFMQDFAQVSVTVEIQNTDRIRININIEQPDNLESTEFVYLWDSAAQELTTE